MKTRVQKWGNSLALRIPKSFAAEVGLKKETSIEVSLLDGKLVITPVARPELTLKQLLAKVTKENCIAKLILAAPWGTKRGKLTSLCAPMRGCSLDYPESTRRS